MADQTATPPASHRDRPAVLTPLTDDGQADLAMQAVAAAGAGADGVDLRFVDDQRALLHGLAAADQLHDVSGLTVFLRTSVPMATGSHTPICSSADQRRDSCVLDLGIDVLGVGAASPEAAARWPEPSGVDTGPGEPFMVCTTGFVGLSDAELMAIATVATLRGASAVSTDRVRIVRRVVDTVAAVVAAESAAPTVPRGRP